jgi:hypothetical protein
VNLDQETLRRHFVKGCLGKRGYKSEGVALRVKDQALQNKRGLSRKYMAGTEPYLCKFCGEWHLGHPS